MGDLAVPRVSAAELLGGGFHVVDVRAPAEFAEGHVPGAVNLPLLDDQERAAVGVTYKLDGAARARFTAMELVAPSLVEYLTALTEMARAQPRRRLAVMCWRGGERSRNVVLLLALIGVHAVAVEGGYRAYRREVLAALQAWRPPVPVITLYGPTGAGKSALLRALADARLGLGGPQPWSVDLESLALHRGSLLGGVNQPGERGQKDFDAIVWEAVRSPQGDYLVLEGEGGKIGKVFLPGSIADAVRSGIPVLVSAPVTERARRIMEEYAPEGWSSDDVARFRRGLGLIGARLSREALASLERAFDDGRFTNVVEGLLVGYYDPLYSKSSVEGRDFAFEFQTSSDPAKDARRFAEQAARLTGEVSFSPGAPDR